MFNNIAQLENEVQEFEKNILASKELIEQLGSVVEAIKTMQSLFSDKSRELIQTVDERSTAGSAALESAIGTITAANTAELEAIDSKLANAVGDLQKASQDLLSNFSAGNRELAESTSQRFDACVENLGKISSSIVSHLNSNKDELTSKYSDFVQRVEASNMDKIYGKLQELEADMNKKFTMILAGVGVAIVVGIISIIL